MNTRNNKHDEHTAVITMSEYCNNGLPLAGITNTINNIKHKAKRLVLVVIKK